MPDLRVLKLLPAASCSLPAEVEKIHHSEPACRLLSAEADYDIDNDTPPWPPSRGDSGEIDFVVGGRLPAVPLQAASCSLPALINMICGYKTPKTPNTSKQSSIDIMLLFTDGYDFRSRPK